VKRFLVHESASAPTIVGVPSQLSWLVILQNFIHACYDSWWYCDNLDNWVVCFSWCWLYENNNNSIA